MKSKLKSIFTVLLALTMGTSLVACNQNNGDNNGDDNSAQTPVALGEAVSFVSIQINPEIEITIDANDLVTSIYGANEDGQILLHGEEDLVGEPIEEVVEIVTDLANEYDYLNEENSVVNTIITSKHKNKINALKNKVNDKIKSRGNKFGFEVKTDEEGSFSLVDAYEKFIEENPTYEGVLTIDKFKLAYSISEAGDIDLLDAVEMDEEELITMLKDLHDSLKGVATDAFKKAKKEAERIYDQAVGEEEAKAYEDYFAKNPSALAYRGNIYTAYKTAEIGFNSLVRAIDLHDKVEDVVLSEDTVNMVIEELGVDADKVDLLKGKDGKVTINSVKHYLDRTFKNIFDIEEKDAFKEIAQNLLAKLEVLVKQNLDLSAYNGDLTVIKNQIAKQISIVNDKVKDMQEIPQEVTDFVAEMEQVIADIETVIADGTLSKEVLMDFAKQMEDGATEILELIEEDFSEHDRNEIHHMREQRKEGCHEEKDRFNGAMHDAEVSAKDYIGNQKEDLKGYGPARR